MLQQIDAHVFLRRSTERERERMAFVSIGFFLKFSAVAPLTSYTDPLSEALNRTAGRKQSLFSRRMFHGSLLALQVDWGSRDLCWLVACFPALPGLMKLFEHWNRPV